MSRDTRSRHDIIIYVIIYIIIYMKNCMQMSRDTCVSWYLSTIFFWFIHIVDLPIHIVDWKWIRHDRYEGGYD